MANDAGRRLDVAETAPPQVLVTSIELARSITPHEQREAARRRGAHEALRAIARSYNVSHGSISSLTS